MKRYLILLLLTVASLKLQAQDLKLDVFGNLNYESKEQRYEASLKKDVFDNLIFTDNNKNELTFAKKYLDLNYKYLQTDEEARVDFFRQVINRFISDRGYKAKFDVDILDNIIIEDNRNGKVEIGTDIFGNTTYEEKRSGVKASVKRDLSGNLEFRAGKAQAQLKKSVFNKWSYSDNSGTKLEFSPEAWNKMLRMYESDENVFLFLVNTFLI
ncbi:hypothetical protein [Pontibacter oryzae]|uniref:DUF481 domain-containing protein n=1 Tax=Pontibacter oryzae TaxID=2304593 RepID=A0A399S4C6_9BACT|nr:hypothetical protein [Pontibacter oryzae]RIJ37253.1 hypothetical protein D1627_08915 [Pontibacter oryzae]